jgi:hypothetical protein
MGMTGIDYIQWVGIKRERLKIINNTLNMKIAA